MKTQLATTQNQSSRLLQCGVSADTADMYYLVDNLHIGYVISAQNPPKGVTLAWSLSALLGLLPISITDESDIYFQLQLTANPHEEDCYKWDLSYYSIDGEITLLYIEAPDPIEACVSMIEELTANGYKLNKI